MITITDLAALPGLPGGSAVTIGAYDGVHLGHQAVLRHVRRLATPRRLPTVVVTFDRHPASVVRPESAPRLLTDLDQKLELLGETGDVDYAVVVAFDSERASEEAEDFVSSVLVKSLRARLVVVGEDFHFGHGRRGNVRLLEEMGASAGFDVVGLGLVAADSTADDRAGTGPVGAGPVSSTAIRELIARGEVATATGLLGRPYEVRGVVGTGDRRGRELGFPTANVDVPAEILLPAEGIYAGWYRRLARRADAVHPAAVALGRRPTFHARADRPVLEAHLLDFDGDLYGEPAAVRFVRRLRAEERFESVEALVVQTGLDVAATRAALEAPPSPPLTARRPEAPQSPP